jgi:hypothetical protein
VPCGLSHRRTVSSCHSPRAQDIPPKVHVFFLDILFYSLHCSSLVPGGCR